MAKEMRNESELLEIFMEYHEDNDNYNNNRAGFRRMYKILDKYGNDDEFVSDMFKRASREDQERMVELITPIGVSSFD